jgi:hypothetical protein
MPDIDIPNRVASQSFLNQTGNLASTILFSPAAAGNFRVSVYAELKAGSTAVVTITFLWTDDDGAQTLALSLGVPGGYSHDTIFIRSASGSISVSASQSGGSTYSLYTAVEEM